MSKMIRGVVGDENFEFKVCDVESILCIRGNINLKVGRLRKTSYPKLFH